MGKYVWSAVLALIFGILIVPHQLGINQYTKSFYFSECDKPFKYKLGSVDPKFGVSEEEFLNYIKQAEDVWEESEGKNLYEFDKNSDFNINLVYDERQELNSKIIQLKGNLEDKQSTIKPELSEFEEKSKEFERRLNKLNNEIEAWNQKGGAPEEEYKRLVEEQNALKTESDNLNEMAKSLNKSASSYNAEVKNLNQTINSFNNAITEKPEEGLYDPANKKIDIYFNISKNELVHTLAHELGHALGIDHNNNKNSIMYGFTSQKLTLTDEDRASLSEVCKRISLLELIKIRLSLYYLYLQHIYNLNNAR